MEQPTDLEIYSKLVKTIESCLTEEHCDAVHNTLENISKTDKNLALSLTYPLRIKINKLNEKS